MQTTNQILRKGRLTLMIGGEGRHVSETRVQYPGLGSQACVCKMAQLELDGVRSCFLGWYAGAKLWQRTTPPPFRLAST